MWKKKRGKRKRREKEEKVGGNSLRDVVGLCGISHVKRR
jgi:hypothetical protein